MTDRVQTCSIPDCNKPSKRRGYCTAHYDKFYTYGDPLAGKTQDGRSKTRAYYSWRAMLARCDRPGVNGYERYHPLGYDSEWADFKKFVFDMGERPLGTSLDRRDNSRGYSKDNCRWATRYQQSANRINSNPTVGVRFNRGAYEAYIWINGKNKYLGRFQSHQAAADRRHVAEAECVASTLELIN